MQSSEHISASRPSLWAPYSPLFFETPDVTTVAGAVEAVADATTPPETSPAAASTDTAPAPSGGTSERQEEVVTSFRLEDVPEAYREHVERYTKLVQGDYTRKMQELAEQRKQLAPMLTLQEALDSDDEEVRDTAISELLAQYGWDIDPGENPEDALADAQAAGAIPEGEGPTTDPAVDARVAALEAQAEAEQQRQYIAAFNTRLNTGLDTWARTQGLDGEGKIPDVQRNQILTLVRGLGPDEQGMPKIDDAIALYEADKAATIQAYVQSKDVPELDLNGGSTASEAQFDPRDDKARLAVANAIAGRHL